uniref:Lysophosphatidylcholine acyltransferase 2-like n=1 Tax=Saccoglossus kowalevskii TaxID=10224 RepID=A0ABM0MYI7_SACKO|nr:PREDICTED: lysophosphatidylcholine acyltransferase 2-like [Saccoglossus kowalevskii]
MSNMTDKSKILRQESLMMPTVHNPFVHKIELSILDKIRIAVCTVTIFPIRLIILLILLLLAWLIARIALLGLKDEDFKEPFSGWRKKLHKPYVSVCCLGRLFAGFRVAVKGQRASREEVTLLVVAPHSSYFDSAVVSGLGMPSAVSKLEMRSVPIIGSLVSVLQPVFVSRNDPESRQKTIKEIKRRAQSGGKWPQIIIFPEGTCTNRSCLIGFKGGAFYPGVAVQPAVIRYHIFPDTVTWTWEGPGAYTILWLTLCNFNNQVEVEFLPVYHPSEEEINDPKLYARNVRAVMAKALNVPVTDHTYEDIRLMLQATEEGLPLHSGLVEFQKLRTKLGLSLENMTDLLAIYSEIARSDDNTIHIDDFAKYLNVPVSPALKEMFELYDRNQSGKIDFREYIIGCSLLSQPANSEDTIQLAFQMFDDGEKGYITQDELSQILHNAFGMTETDVAKLFQQVDSDGCGRITYDEFKMYAQKKPEYAMLFKTYQEMKVKEDSAETPKDGKLKSE